MCYPVGTRYLYIYIGPFFLLSVDCDQTNIQIGLGVMFQLYRGGQFLPGGGGGWGGGGGVKRRKPPA